ncbi:hypothetical protein JRO89_XS10G0177200 [Xanthoceras sorbifolium]|uniref:BHLH domain-containing protein n=1 Tax=Xanthoceras sorbifolium TaxID=99658 RepID=A0ABQ8HJ86_9ROSI|nr:hypothetical protein JRO89_XS10G0177200 [Xanthoceras sorbifolium]
MEMDASGIIPLMQTNDFQVQLHDFIDHPNFDQFVDLIRGENEDTFGCLDHDLINGFPVDNHQFGSAPLDVFALNETSCTMVSDLNFVLNSMPSTLHGDTKEMEEEEEDNEEDEDDSSGTTIRTTTTNGRKTKTDRAKTLISERRRRGRMKEKLYQLRALVPNITKMDKASIVGDAVLYVQNLQTKAKKLKAEIASLEASLAANSERHQESTQNYSKRNQVPRRVNLPISKEIMQMDVFQVEERSFYARLVCNKGEGVAASLYKALESLTSFNVQNSNLSTVSERLVIDSEPGMNLPNLKLWVTGALLNQGFEVLTILSA